MLWSTVGGGKFGRGGETVKREVYWLWCVMVFGMANKRLWDVSGGFDSVVDFVDAMQRHEVEGVDDRVRANADRVTLEQAYEQLLLCEEKGQRCVCFDNEDYPSELRRIAAAPAVLFYRGDIGVLRDKCVLDITGAREPSEYSVGVTRAICGQLIERGFLLSSGFADGVDKLVNNASLEMGGKAVAVLGQPIDIDRSREEAELKERIAENGVLISEYFPGSANVSGGFALRNRISVGISKGLIFVEASAHSKGLNNFQHAVDQGKPVFVVPPHDILDSRYFGQADLLRNECRAIFDANDVVYELSQGGYYDFGFVNGPVGYNLPAQDLQVFKREDEKPKSVRRKKNEGKNNDEKETVQVDLAALSEVQAKIYDALDGGEMLADEVAFRTKMDIAEVLRELTLLELDGVVERLPGQRFRSRGRK